MINFISNNLDACFKEYLQSLREQGKSRPSVRDFRNPTRQLIKFLSGKGITTPKMLCIKEIEAFELNLYEERDLSQRSIVAYLRDIQLFLNYLFERGYLKINFANDLVALPKPEITPKHQSHHYTLDEAIARYITYQSKWVSYGYVHNIKKHLKGFRKYLNANETKSIYTVTQSTFIKYREYLWDNFINDHEGLVVRSQKERLRCIVRFFRFLYKEGILKENPTENLGWDQYFKEIRNKARNLPVKEENTENETGLKSLMIKFLDYEKSRDKSKSTVYKYQKGIEEFFLFMEENGMGTLDQVNKKHMLKFFTSLCNYIGVRGQPASNSHKNHLLWSVKMFFRFLVRFDFLTKDPSLDLECIKEEKGLPTSCLNKKEVFELLQRPQLSHDPLSCRDKAIMELLFSTGMRSNEMCSLNIEDIDYHMGMVRINNPKGGKGYQRIVPVGGLAIKYIKTYMKDSRPQITQGDAKALFLSFSGRRIQTEAVLNIIKKYAFQCGFRKNITPHSFGVTCATMMLKNGADIRYVQEQLGHKKITSTQIYTRLMPLDLKHAHRRFHPRESRK
jgi:integrase/recombinase XerD